MADEKKDLLKEAKDNYKIAHEAWEHNQKLWLEDAKFRALDQWPEAIKKKREADGNPCLVVDKLNQYIRQVVNDGRQNRPAVKVRPIDDKADIKAADGFQGLIRSICNRSNADDAYDTALDHAAGNGFGYIRVITEYAHEQTLEQDICVRRVRNPIAVVLGPHEQADGSDAEYGFVETREPKASFKSKWPNAKEINWESEGYADGWADEHTIRVCEYFYKVKRSTTIYLLKDGTTATDEEYQRALKETGKVPEVIKSREVEECEVKWCRLTGAEILEENDWPGKYIPIIPVYGNESDIEGKVTYSGLVRAGRDPQILHNFARSAFAQRVALSPKAPWIAAEGQIEGYEEIWRTANSSNVAVLPYKPIDNSGNPVPPPSRVQASDIPAGFIQDMQASEHDIQGALGMYNASLGERSNEKSGKAIMARQREGDTATFHYQDNLNRAIRHLGRILVDLVPKIYDSTRVVRLLGEDGTTTDARIDPRLDVAYKDDGGKAIYNLGVGIYDVDVSAGPSFTTRRQESAEAMLEMSRANPTMWQTHGDLIVKAQDWPNADEFAKRSKMALPPPIAQQVQAEEQQGQSPEVAAATAPLKQALDQAGQQIHDAEAGIAERDQALQQAQQELEAAKQDKELEAKKLDIEDYKAKTERMQVLAPAVAPDQIQQIVVQTLQALMSQPDPQSAPGPMQPMQPMPPEEPEPQPDMSMAMPPGMAPQPNQPPSGGFFTPGG